MTPSPIPKRAAKYDAPAVRLAVRLIEFLADADRPAGISEIAGRIGTNKNMATRLLSTLEREDWVRRAPDGPGFALTLRPFHFVGKMLRRMDLVSAAEGPMKDLLGRVDEYVYLGILHGRRVMFVRDFRPRHKPVQIGGGVGFHYPLHDNAPGKVLLAWGGEELLAGVVREGLPRTSPATVTDPRELRRELERIRRRGFATDLEENAGGVLCLAAPVFDHEGKVAGSVGVTTLTVFYTRQDLVRKLGPPVREAARRISSAMGHVSGNGRDTK
jgi:DNA-binding IclR family transcriptional regulator